MSSIVAEWQVAHNKRPTKTSMKDLRRRKIRRKLNRISRDMVSYMVKDFYEYNFR